MTRWPEYIGFGVNHIPADQNGAADSLSRYEFIYLNDKGDKEGE
jgi:hypothetical protein